MSTQTTNSPLKYQITIENPQQRFVKIRAEFPVNDKITTMKLPAWRPGRYELGNFAKNIKGFRVLDANSKELTYRKTNKDTWEIESENSDSITVEYLYFANELNAGSTYFDEQQLYVNPVNCMVYVPELVNTPIELKLEINSDWKIACGLKKENNVLFAKDFDELADSPFICSSQMESVAYEVQGYKFYIWFNGISNIPWERVVADFQKFTTKQIEHFGHFPAPEFHFLIHALPYTAYHGVEHLTTTVITLGPSHHVFKDLYKELLGVSSHELYHVWNVKSIRPTDMLPYNFSQENYSELGYVYEGVTTYLGDLYLLKSGVFDLANYFLEFNNQLQKHFDNAGRFNYSVAQSSFDTWLDGYVPGIPGRKTSIYTEGCLLAFVSDIYIRRATNNQKGLEDAMRTLYTVFAQKGIGYDAETYKHILETTAGISFDALFTNYFYGTEDYEQILNECLNYLGLKIAKIPSKSYAESKLGIKSLPKNGNAVITAIAPESPASSVCSISDEILSVNGYKLNNDLDNWLTFSASETNSLSIIRNGKLLEITLTANDSTFYPKYEVQLQEQLSEEQKAALRAWAEIKN